MFGAVSPVFVFAHERLCLFDGYLILEAKPLILRKLIGRT
jgi:hypothetical protein